MKHSKLTHNSKAYLRQASIQDPVCFAFCFSWRLKYQLDQQKHIQDFPDESTNPKSGDGKLLFWPFSPKLHGNEKKTWTEERGTHPWNPLGSTNVNVTSRLLGSFFLPQKVVAPAQKSENIRHNQEMSRTELYFSKKETFLSIKKYQNRLLLP